MKVYQFDNTREIIFYKSHLKSLSNRSEVHNTSRSHLYYKDDLDVAYKNIVCNIFLLNLSCTKLASM